ncbi:MAG: FAD-dependent oxidoreductase [Proteobacteria bacterium]|nr:FAD-dependent oxidoreductase [Pseudomonadota bacterium]
MGTSAAYYLARAGHKVALLDQYAIPNEWQASGDHARVFRYTYGKDMFYTELAVKALDLWKEFQKEVHEDLYVATGMLDIALKDGGYEDQCFKSLTAMKLPVFKLDAHEMRERFRIFNARAMKYGVFHPDGGMIWAQRSVAAFSNAAQRRRALFYANVKVSSILRGKEGIEGVKDAKGKVWRATSYLFAPGPWAKEFLASYKIPLKVTKQPLLYFRPPSNQGRFRPGHCPVYACLTRGFYGFPVHIHGFMKIGDHRKGKPGKPGPGPNEVDPQMERNCRRFLREFMPDAAEFVDTEGKMCYYNNTPDDDFIVDKLPDAPNAVVATGLSGHGFKFGPLLGKLCGDLLLTGKTDLNLTRFKLDRFKGKK